MYTSRGPVGKNIYAPSQVPAKPASPRQEASRPSALAIGFTGAVPGPSKTKFRVDLIAGRPNAYPNGKEFGDVVPGGVLGLSDYFMEVL
jgi:hypothetical protein